MKCAKSITVVVIAAVAAAIGVLFLLDVFHVAFFADSTADSLCKGTIMRGLACIALTAIACCCGYDFLGFRGLRGKNLLAVLPLFLVPFNNFPFIDFFAGRLTLYNADLIPLFAAQCLAVGLMEELAFRGILLSFCLEKKSATKKQRLAAVLISAAAFGLFHLLNLFSGGNAGATLLQTLYAFGLGALLGLVMLKTKCVWLCALLHAIYNFGGMLFPVLGGGNVWSTSTVLLTAAVAVVVCGYAVLLFCKSRRTYAEDLAGRRL